MSYGLLRPLGFLDVLDGAFTLYRRNFVTAIGVVALLYGPAALVLGAFSGWTEAAEVSGLGPAGGALLALGFLVAVLLALVMYSASEGALMRLVSDVVLGGRASLGDACRAALGRLGPLVAGSVLRGLAVTGAVFAGAMVAAGGAAVGGAGGDRTVAGLLIAVGVVLAIGLGLAVFAATYAVAPIIVLEGAGPVTAIRRSARLSKGRRSRILGVYLVASVLAGVLAGGGAILGELFLDDPVALGVWEQVLNLLLLPYLGICVALLYYDARVRLEAYDLEWLARELGRGTAAG